MDADTTSPEFEVSPLETSLQGGDIPSLGGLFLDREDAVTFANLWILSKGWNEVLSANRLVQKVPLNKIFHNDVGMEYAYMVLFPWGDAALDIESEAEGCRAVALGKYQQLKTQAQELVNDNPWLQGE